MTADDTARTERPTDSPAWDYYEEKVAAAAEAAAGRVYTPAVEAMPCACCFEVIEPGEDYVMDGDTGKPIGFECGCGDPLYADGVAS